MVWTAVLVGSALNFTYYGLIFVLGLYLQRAVGWGPQAGLAFLPLTATFIVSNLVSGGLVARRFGARDHGRRADRGGRLRPDQRGWGRGVRSSKCCPAS
jgi:hypothetical protein